MGDENEVRKFFNIDPSEELRPRQAWWVVVLKKEKEFRFVVSGYRKSVVNQIPDNRETGYSNVLLLLWSQYYCYCCWLKRTQWKSFSTSTLRRNWDRGKSEDQSEGRVGNVRNHTLLVVIGPKMLLVHHFFIFATMSGGSLLSVHIKCVRHS